MLKCTQPRDEPSTTIVHRITSHEPRGATQERSRHAHGVFETVATHHLGNYFFPLRRSTRPIDLKPFCCGVGKAERALIGASSQRAGTQGHVRTLKKCATQLSTRRVKISCNLEGVLACVEKHTLGGWWLPV